LVAELDPLGIMYADLHSKMNKTLASPGKTLETSDIPREVVVRQYLHALGKPETTMFWLDLLICFLINATYSSFLFLFFVFCCFFLFFFLSLLLLLTYIVEVILSVLINPTVKILRHVL